MKQITYSDIKALNPCYNPIKYIPEDWTGTVLDILNVEDCPAKDRLWVVLREEFIDAKTLRLFTVWCAREALKLVENPDARSVEACNVAERYANGEATDKERAAARAAAREAAVRAAATEAAARAAAREAVVRAGATEAATEAAAHAAAREAMGAWEERKARKAEREAQINYLKTMIQ